MSMNQYFPEPYECSSGNEMSNWIYHGTIVVTRITRRNIPYYMCDSACRWLIAENATIIRSFVKYFLIFRRERNCRIFTGLYK